MKPERILFASLFTLAFIVGTPLAYAAVDPSHIGFVESRLWFDHEPFFAGQSVRIYTTIANSSSADFSGSVEFYARDERIGKVPVTLQHGGGFQVVSADFVPEEGEYALSVRITEGMIVEEGKEPQSISYEFAAAAPITRMVVADTDGDGVGNDVDADDDNDSIPDSDDAKPLTKAVTEEREGQKQSEGARVTFTERAEEIALRTAPKIVAAAQAAIATVEDFRGNQSATVLRHKAEATARVEEEKHARATGETDPEEKYAPFNQLRLLALTAAGYTLSNKIIFYLAGAFLLYLLIRKIIPRIIRWFRREPSFE